MDEGSLAAYNFVVDVASAPQASGTAAPPFFVFVLYWAAVMARRRF
jgi:hypothetical protein